MGKDSIFPLLTGGNPTLETLHWYARGIGVIPRTHLEQHPKWWHLSLNVVSDGVVTHGIPIPNVGGALLIKLDLRLHKVILTASYGDVQSFSLEERLTSTAFGDQIIAAVAELGFKGDYALVKFSNAEPREYHPEIAERYLHVWNHVDRIFNKHLASLEGETSPVQLWPHGFDMSIEWFGTRMVESESNDKVTTYPAQLNLGFSPGESSHPEPYFYSNPWPFEEHKLVDKQLPNGARWFTEGWKGTILPYADLVDDSNAEDRLLAYAQAVYEISVPNLLA